MSSGIQRSRLPVADSGIEFGSENIQMSEPMRELFIANDSSVAGLILTVVGRKELCFALKAGETFDERFEEFTSIKVEATDGWRWYVRSGRME